MEVEEITSDTKEPKQRKDQVKDQAATINCLEVGEMTQISRGSENLRQAKLAANVLG